MTDPTTISPLATQRRWRAWVGLVLGLVICLALLVWAGAASGPRSALPWDWTASGWIIPTPGFTWIWFAAALVLWLLSTLAWLLFTTPPGTTKLKPWVSAALILLISAASHLAIAQTWTPLGKAFVGSPLLPQPALISANIAAVGALLFILHLQRQSLWWATLYAWHPLVLIEVAAHSTPLALVPFALLILVAAAGKVRWLIVPVALGLLALGVCDLAAAATRPPFNSFVWELARNFVCRGNEVLTTRTLTALLALLELAVVLLGRRRRWDLPTTLGHMFVIFLLCTPVMLPAQVLLPLILLPLAWNRAIWIVSLVSLSAYAAVLMQRQGYGFMLPDWLLMIAWMPVAVVEAHALLIETWCGFRSASLRVSPAPR